MKQDYISNTLCVGYLAFWQVIDLYKEREDFYITFAEPWRVVLSMAKSMKDAQHR